MSQPNAWILWTRIITVRGYYTHGWPKYGTSSRYEKRTHANYSYNNKCARNKLVSEMGSRGLVGPPLVTMPVLGLIGVRAIVEISYALSRPPSITFIGSGSRE